MRIMLVTFRFGNDISGGAERYLWELMTRLAGRGHDVEVFTTCSLQMIRSPFGYMLWDNFFPEGGIEDSGLLINRYPVKNPHPKRARRLWRKLDDLKVREMRKPEFLEFMTCALKGVEEHCFLSGWHASESWNSSEARWSQKQGQLVVGGKGMTGLRLEVTSPIDGRVTIEVPGVIQAGYDLKQGRQRSIEISFSPQDAIALKLKASRTVRPAEDRRNLGILVSALSVHDGSGYTRDLDMVRGWTEFVEGAPEEALGKALWWLANAMPLKASKYHKYVMGPNSVKLEREVREKAGDFDVVMGSMSPMSTLSLAAEAATASGRPFVAFPLFHSRDPNHFQAHLYQAMSNAMDVEANLPGIAELMEGWNFKAFSIGPGFNLEEQLSSDIDGARFRLDFGFDGSPMLLWVARKNSGKGYQEAIKALEYVRAMGIPAVLVMIGPDEDHLPVSGEGVHYLGSLPRSMVLDAYDACDAFIFPSLHESFCLVFCEAWLRGKPVLGNVYCAAARDQIIHSGDGYLCREPREYGERAVELLRDPELARSMGERGKKKVMDSRGWDKIVGELEIKLEKTISSYSGTKSEHSGV